MPRLLLVDDNPSIHKIAETLLATSHIELVCVDSAAAALGKVDQGEHFDVALVDTSMAVMDGWGLLAKLRERPSTARMPIAMMAGVLDTVDPERIKAAPIQGFLKKPVELKNLGERVLQLMETPVPLPEPPAPAPMAISPFATMPATRIEDLPEFRKQASEEPVADDLLELTEEDLYPEPETEAPKEETLDLEELDLESLQGLPPLPETPSVPLPVVAEALEVVSGHPESAAGEGEWGSETLDALAALDRRPVPAVLEAEESAPQVPVAEFEFPDLEVPAEGIMDISSLGNLPEVEEFVASEQVTAPEVPLAGLPEMSQEEALFTPPPSVEEPLDWSDDSESMLLAVAAPAPAESMPLPSEDMDLLDVAVPEIAAEPSLLLLDLEETSPVIEEQPSLVVPAMGVPEAAPAAVEIPPAEEAVPVSAPAPAIGTRELLDAMKSDPVLMDELAKAVVARLGDQVLREIAWEVMPELAERLPRS